MRIRTHLAAAITAAVAITALAAPAVAATSTYTDKAGDVLTVTGAPKNTQNANIDILTVTTTATAKTTKVTIKVADVASDATHFQEFAVQIVPAATTPDGATMIPAGIVIGSVQDKAHQTPVCYANTYDHNDETDISSQVTCVRNPAADTVTFTVPTSAVPGTPKRLFTNVAAYAKVQTAAGRFPITAGDHTPIVATKIG